MFLEGFRAGKFGMGFFVVDFRMYVASITFGLPLKMNGMHRTQFYHERLDLLSRVIEYLSPVKLSQSTEMEQKRFDLRSLSPALRNLWLLLVLLFYY